MLFHLVLTKFFKGELFSCLPKAVHVIKSCKEPISFHLLVASYADADEQRRAKPVRIGSAHVSCFGSTAH